MLKLLAVELHSADVTSALHRETCQSILAQLFGQSIAEYRNDGDSFYVPQNNSEVARIGSIGKIKVPVAIRDCFIVYLEKHLLPNLFLWLNSLKLLGLLGKCDSEMQLSMHIQYEG